MKNTDFLENADNVYRTRCFIVKQEMEVAKSEVYNNVVISHDTFYLRTYERDVQYEKAFSKKGNINGKRLPSSTTTRKYIC